MQLAPHLETIFLHGVVTKINMEEILPKEEIVTKEKEETAKHNGGFFGKITHLKKQTKIVIIAGIVLVVGILLVVIPITTRQPRNVSNNQSTLPIFPSSLILEPNQMTIASRKLESADVSLEVGERSVSDVTFTVTFDPTAIESFNISQELDKTSALSYSLIVEDTNVDVAGGKATIHLGLKKGATEQIGKGVIAKIYFVVKPTFIGESNIKLSTATITSKANATKGRFSPQKNRLIIIKGK